MEPIPKDLPYLPPIKAAKKRVHSQGLDPLSSTGEHRNKHEKCLVRSSRNDPGLTGPNG